jgi:Peptidase family M20/M25/M40
VNAAAVGGTGRIVRIGPQSGPCVAIRAELDALPVAEQTGVPRASPTGAMHACGHDVHLAALARAARGVELPAALLAVLQPREETSPLGAPDIVASAAFAAQQPCAIVGVHLQHQLPPATVAATPGRGHKRPRDGGRSGRSPSRRTGYAAMDTIRRRTSRRSGAARRHAGHAQRRPLDRGDHGGQLPAGVRRSLASLVLLLGSGGDGGEPFTHGAQPAAPRPRPQHQIRGPCRDDRTSKTGNEQGNHVIPFPFTAGGLAGLSRLCEPVPRPRRLAADRRPCGRAEPGNRGPGADRGRRLSPGPGRQLAWW